MKTKNQLEKEWISMNQDLRTEKFNHKLTKMGMILFFVACLVFAFLGAMQQNKIEELEENQVVDKLIFQTRCFQRILHWDRTWDIETNFINGYYWNTTWHETECEKYDKFVLSMVGEEK